MPRLMAVWKHPKYRTLYIREPIPPDLWAANNGKRTYKRTLGTDQLSEARKKYPAALNAFYVFLDGLRSGPRRLTAQDVEGLVGIWYREKLAAWSVDPGAAKDWALTWEALPGGDAPGDQQARSRLVSPAADRLLEESGLIVDAASREALEGRLFARMVDLVSRVELRAGGDYSPDPVLVQFPAPPVVASRGTRSAAVADGLHPDGSPTWDAMFSRWEGAAVRRADTVAEYRGVWSAFRQFVQGVRPEQQDRPADVETHDVERWRSALAVAGIGGRPLKRRTIQTKYLAAVSAIYSASQGKGRGRLSGNPVEGAWFKGKAEHFPDSREVRPYSPAELAAILRASRSETLPERRWLPWLMAYSGARFREATQSLASDIRELDGIPYLSINRDQSFKRLKNPSSERNVPLHSLLIAEGFLDYVRSLAPGEFLFPRMKPRANGESNEGRPVTHLREWVSSLIVADEGSRVIMKATHSFRHSFEDLLRKATKGSDELRYAIQGRESGSSAAGYGAGYTLRQMHEALEQISPLV